MPWIKVVLGFWNFTVIRLLSFLSVLNRDMMGVKKSGVWSQNKLRSSNKMQSIKNAFQRPFILWILNSVQIRDWPIENFIHVQVYTSELEAVQWMDQTVHVLYMCTCHGKFSNTKCGTWTRNEGHLLSTTWLSLDSSKPSLEEPDRRFFTFKWGSLVGQKKLPQNN